MNPDATKLALDRIQKLKADISDAEKEVDELERFLATYQKLTGRQAVTIRDEPSLPVTNGSSHGDAPDAYEPIRRAFRAGQARGKSKTQATLDAIEVILGRAKGPMTPRDIYRQLSMAGIEVSGKVPQNTVSAMLSNARPRFEKDPAGRGWTMPKPVGFWASEQRTEVKGGALQ